MTRTALALFAAMVLAAGAPLPRPGDALFRLDYLYGVAIECGLADDAVTAGYSSASGREIVRLGLTEASRRRVRLAALVAVDVEWGNRGLGGHRLWCRDEGADAAALFRALASDP